VTPAELREAARAQNERDAAAGLLPSRYVEDVGVLTRVAGLLADVDQADDGGGRSVSPTAASSRAAKKGNP
jgi:hypothetical protein